MQGLLVGLYIKFGNNLPTLENITEDRDIAKSTAIGPLGWHKWPIGSFDHQGIELGKL